MTGTYLPFYTVSARDKELTSSPLQNQILSQPATTPIDALHRLKSENDASSTPDRAATFGFALNSEVEIKARNATTSNTSHRRSVVVNNTTTGILGSFIHNSSSSQHSFTESNNGTAAKTSNRRSIALGNITNGTFLSNYYFENLTQHTFILRFKQSHCKKHFQSTPTGSEKR